MLEPEFFFSPYPVTDIKSINIYIIAIRTGVKHQRIRNFSCIDFKVFGTFLRKSSFNIVPEELRELFSFLYAPVFKKKEGCFICIKDLPVWICSENGVRVLRRRMIYHVFLHSYRDFLFYFPSFFFSFGQPVTFNEYQSPISFFAWTAGFR